MMHELASHWSEMYLFQEELGEIVDIQSVVLDSSEESDSQSISLSQQTPADSFRDLPGSVASEQPELEMGQPKRKPHCAFQWEKKR